MPSTVIILSEVFSRLFFGLDEFSRPGSGRDKKDAESSKIASSPYKRTAETVFGGRKSG